MTGSPEHREQPTADQLLEWVRNLAANVLWSPHADARTAVQLAQRVRQLDELLSRQTGRLPTEWQPR